MILHNLFCSNDWLLTVILSLHYVDYCFFPQHSHAKWVRMTIFGRFGWQVRGLWKGGHILRQKHCIRYLRSPTSTLAPQVCQGVHRLPVMPENFTAPSARTTHVWSQIWQGMSRSTQEKNPLPVHSVLIDHMKNQRLKDTWIFIYNSRHQVQQ